MGQKILLSALVLAATTSFLCDFASAREWPNDMREPVTHPIIGVSNVSQLDPAKLKPELYRQLRELDSSSDWAKYSRNDMADVEIKAVERLNTLLVNLAYTDVTNLLGPPDLYDGPEPDLRTSQDMHIFWFYQFGYSMVPIRLEFHRGKCVHCRFTMKSDIDQIRYIHARLKKHCIGKSESEVEELFHKKLRALNQSSSAPVSTYKDNESYTKVWQPPLPPGPPPGSKYCMSFWDYAFDFHFTESKCDWVGTSVCF